MRGDTSQDPWADKKGWLGQMHLGLATQIRAGWAHQDTECHLIIPIPSEDHIRILRDVHQSRGPGPSHLLISDEDGRTPLEIRLIANLPGGFCHRDSGLINMAELESASFPRAQGLAAPERIRRVSEGIWIESTDPQERQRGWSSRLIWQKELLTAALIMSPSEEIAAKRMSWLYSQVPGFDILRDGVEISSLDGGPPSRIIHPPVPRPYLETLLSSDDPKTRSRGLALVTRANGPPTHPTDPDSRRPRR